MMTKKLPSEHQLLWIYVQTLQRSRKKMILFWFIRFFPEHSV